MGRLMEDHERKGCSRSTAPVLAEADDEVCWICLAGPEPGRLLQHPCRCPSWAHAHCIARWQLQSAGTRREHFCDFCRVRLPDWKAVLTPDGDTTSAPAIMNVNFDNRTYSFTVRPGPDGYRQFTLAIRRAFLLPEDSELNITFTCDEPSSGSMLTLSGPGAYDAAVHCAAVSASRRSSISSSEGGAPEGGGGAEPAADHVQVAERSALAARGPGPWPCPTQRHASSSGSSAADYGGGGSDDSSSDSDGSSADGAPGAGAAPSGAAAVGMQDGDSAALVAVRRESVSGIARRLRSVLNDMLASR